MSIRLPVIVAFFICIAECSGDTTISPFVASFDRFVPSGAVDADTGGRLLLSELNCAACHATKTPELRPKLGPNLDGVGNRLQEMWLEEFLANPQAAKPGTTMPSMLHGLPPRKKDRAVQALAAFLSVQRSPFPKLKSDAKNPIAHEFWLKGDSHRGRMLYHQIGCVACHEPDDNYEIAPRKPTELEKLLAGLTPKEIKELNLPLPPRPVKSVPLADLAAKYTRRSLTFFLLEPESIRPGGRMPNFHLQPNEAADVAAYLLRDQALGVNASSSATDVALIKEGRHLFKKMHCVNCHSMAGMKPSRGAKALAALHLKAKESCLDKTQPGLPHFDLDDFQRNALRTALVGLSDPASKKEPSAKRQLEFHFLQLNCYACHRREKRGGIDPKRRPYFETAGHVDLGDEGRLPPPLDGVGAKLKRNWLKKVLVEGVELRPHMLARMPKFAKASAAAIPELLAKTDAAGQLSQREVFGDIQTLAKAGRRLVDAGGCVQCHPLRGESLPGVIGIDLAKIDNRLHPQWFHDFMHDPAKLKPGTRMPALFPVGKSPFPDMLDGDVNRQIAAMWAYLREIEHLPLPEKMTQARLQSFELIPKERPIVLRTFMKAAGPLAIAVGFPQKVHFAFDAEEVGLAMAWRGRFLDAHGTWFNRLAPPATPLGADVISMPKRALVAVATKGKSPCFSKQNSEVSYRFRGYRIDDKGVPTFLYQFGQFDVEDRITPAADQALRRQLKISLRRKKNGQKGTVGFRASTGKHLQRLGPFKYKNDAGLITRVSPGPADGGKLHKLGQRTEWIIPLDINGEKTIEVIYQW